MGFDALAVQDIIEEKGIWQNNMNIVMDAIRKGPAYFNPLKLQMAPASQPFMSVQQPGGMPIMQQHQ